MRICECCGREFEPKQMRSKYCSRQCQARGFYQSQPKGEMKKCVWCGKTYYAPSKHRKYCSEHCRYQATYEKMKAKLEQKEKEHIMPTFQPKVCKYCGEEFIPTHSTQKYCNPTHAELWRRRERTLLQNERERAKKEAPKMVKKEEKYVSPASKRWAKMSLTELDRELLYYHIDYGQSQVMAKNNTLPEDFGLKKVK